MREIYLDNAAATLTDRRVVAAIVRATREAGNPSSPNAAGRRARAILEHARTSIARFLNARTDEIVLCASGSEANALALLGVAEALGKRGHIVTTPIEHPSVLESVKKLKRNGWKVGMVPVDSEGRVRAADVVAMITPRTRLISVMYANNEIGTIQDIKKIVRAVRQYRKAHRTPHPYVHTDACQATEYLPMDVQALGVDLLSFNGSKVHGPRGAAVLYVRRGVTVVSQVLGGSQERGRRAGTEDVPGAVGLATALGLIGPGDTTRVAALRDYFFKQLPAVISDARINGPQGKDRLANNINISIPGVASEELLLELDRQGISAGAGSACTAHRVEPSHVLRAIGASRKYLAGALRISLSRHTTRQEIDEVLRVLPKAIAILRSRFRK